MDINLLTLLEITMDKGRTGFQRDCQHTEHRPPRQLKKRASFRPCWDSWAEGECRAGQRLGGDDSAGNFRETTTIITQPRQLPGKQLGLRTEAKIEVEGCIPLLKLWSIHSQVHPHCKNAKTLLRKSLIIYNLK